MTVLIHLGEMATDTVLDEDTFELLGAELGYVIKIVSPRTKSANCSNPSTSTWLPKPRLRATKYLKYARPS